MLDELGLLEELLDSELVDELLSVLDDDDIVDEELLEELLSSLWLELLLESVLVEDDVPRLELLELESVEVLELLDDESVDVLLLDRVLVLLEESSAAL